MAGAPPSALRAAIMFTIVALGITTDSEGHALNTLLAAAFTLLLANPTWLFSVGFQLSFGAVLSMLVFFKPIFQVWPQSTRLGRVIWQAVSASVAAEVLTAPLVIYYFHSFPLLFPVANLLSAVLIGFCALVGGLAIIAFSWIPAIAHGLGWIVTHVVLLFNEAIAHLQALNPVSFQYLQISRKELFIIYLLISGGTGFLLQRKKTGLFVAMTAACILIALLTIDQHDSLKQERLVVYNNGKHAQIELIRGRQYQTLFAADGEAESYTSRAAHTGWQAWRAVENGGQVQFTSINEKKVLILSDTSTNTWNTPWPVDILVLCRPLKGLIPDKILHTFRPSKVILASRPYDYQLPIWQASCSAQGIPLHLVAVKGAYILE
jgi:competence protein ComEC